MNRESLASYPTFSRDWEELGTKICSDILEQTEDYYSGPRGLSRIGAELMTSYPGKQENVPDRHDSIFGFLIDAKFSKQFNEDNRPKIVGVTVPFEYPNPNPKQKKTIHKL
jgi:hypothetical protein